VDGNEITEWSANLAKFLVWQKKKKRQIPSVSSAARRALVDTNPDDLPQEECETRFASWGIS